MKDLDHRIGAELAALRRVPVPKTPRLGTAAPEAQRGPAALVAAAAMLTVLAGSLHFIPSRPAPSAALLADRIAVLEARIGRLESEELRTLFGRELALLRRELELSQAR